jgi:hypothetical protein
LVGLLIGWLVGPIASYTTSSGSTFGFHDCSPNLVPNLDRAKNLVGWPANRPDFLPDPDLEQKKGHVNNDLDSLNLDYFAKVFAKKGKKK